MKEQSVKRQATVLTGANIITRAMGFFLRVALGRLMGAQALGVMELSHSAHMLSIAPVTAGLPMAVSRLTARDGGRGALHAGDSLVLRVSLIWMPVWALFSPLIAYLLGDMRVLPALWAFTPCILILGLSGVRNGYCYGAGNAWPPALSELIEQLLRCALSIALLKGLTSLTVAGRAAVPAFATVIAEGAGLWLVFRLIRGGAREKAKRETRRELVSLSLPFTITRLMGTGLRAATGALIPLRLMASGLAHAEALACLGMLQGMVMPVLFLPGVFTSAVGMVGAPAIARRSGKNARGMAVRLFVSAAVCGALGMGAISLLSGFLADRIYRLPELKPLFAQAAPLTLLFSLQHAVNGLLAGLGEQKRTLAPSLIGASVTLLCIYLWTALPPMRLYGAALGMIVGQSVTLLCSLSALLHAFARQAAKAVTPS